MPMSNQETTTHTPASAEQYADPDSHFVDVRGIRIHYKRAGQGEPVLLLVHGSFLSHYSWREVMTPLAEKGTVIAFDRPAFGLTERVLPGATPENPYTPEGQADYTVALLDSLGIERAVLVGSSAGGTTSLLAALRHPQRVAGLVLVGAMVYSGYAVSEFPPWLRSLLRALGPLGALPVRLMIGLMHDKAIRSFWHEPDRLSPDVLAAYRRALQVRHWDRAVWELVLSSHALHLAEQLDHIQVPVLVVTGGEDRTVPAEQSKRLHTALPAAELAVLPQCGHLPHEECPHVFLEAVTGFIDRIASDG